MKLKKDEMCMLKGIIKNYLILASVLVMCLALVSCQSTNRQALTNPNLSQRIQADDKNYSNSSNGNKELSKFSSDNEMAKIELENLVAITSDKSGSEEVKQVTQSEDNEVKAEVGQAVDNKETNPTNNNNEGNKDKEENKDNENNQGDGDNAGDKNNVSNRSIGIINDLYISNNKIYITVDSLEFFRGEQAYNEARKDGKLYVDETGKEFLPDGYYIRNNSSELKTYEVSSNALFNLCVYIVDPNTTQNSAETVGVEYSYFEKYINSTKGLNGRSRMFWINEDNGIVNKLEMQFTP